MKKKNKCVIAKIYSKKAYVMVENNILDLDDKMFIVSSVGAIPGCEFTIFMSDKSAKNEEFDLIKYRNDLDYFVDILTSESLIDEIEYEIRNYTDAELDLIYGIFK